MRPSHSYSKQTRLSVLVTTVNCDNAALSVLQFFGFKLQGHLEVYIIKANLDL